MNRKRKVLMLCEAPWYTTGYSVYATQVLGRLCQHDDLEIAQLGIYAGAKDPQLTQYPWKIYWNKPEKDHPNYSSYKNPTAQFGDFNFNEVLLDFQPDVVMDIRDWWMIEFEQRSPFRDFYNWAIMPTVDAKPQNNQWIATYEDADAVFAYSEFGRDVLMEQSDNMKFVDLAPPAASKIFMPVPDKKHHRNEHGIHPAAFIIGTVMRNQKRKLYPDLLKSFRDFLDKTDKPNAFLYCHTYYPDIGWDVPALLDEYSLSNRVLFTYKCKQCKSVSTNFFNDSVQHCKKCGEFKNQLVGLSNPMSEEDLADIYNLFDVYVQYANSEGFGMPQLEAAYCGLPVISTYYSAMESVINNIGGIGIKPKSFMKECETGCLRAIPDNEAFVECLLELSNKTSEEIREMGLEVMRKARTHYSWDKTAEAWLKYIRGVELKDHRLTWNSPIKIHRPAEGIPSNLKTIVEQVNFLFANVLNKPEWIGNYFWRRVVKDCTFGYRSENVDGDFYFNESHVQSYNKYVPFSLQEAYNECVNYRTQLNTWEQARQQRMNQNASN